MWFHQYFYVLLANTGPSNFDIIFKVRLCTEIKCQPTDLGVPLIYILQVYWPRCVALVFVPPPPQQHMCKFWKTKQNKADTLKRSPAESLGDTQKTGLLHFKPHVSGSAVECFDSRVVGQQKTGQFHHLSKVLTHTHPHKAYPLRYYGHREQSHKSFLSFIISLITNQWGPSHLDEWTSEASGLLVFIIIGSSLWTNQKMDNLGRRSCGRSCWSSRLKKPRREVGLL